MLNYPIFPFLSENNFEKFKNNKLNILDFIGRNVSNYTDTLEECSHLNITNKIQGINCENYNVKIAHNNYKNDNLTDIIKKIYEPIIEFINIPIIQNNKIYEVSSGKTYSCNSDNEEVLNIKKILSNKYDIIVLEQVLHLIEYKDVEFMLKNLTNDGCIFQIKNTSHKNSKFHINMKNINMNFKLKNETTSFYNKNNIVGLKHIKNNNKYLFKNGFIWNVFELIKS